MTEKALISLDEAVQKGQTLLAGLKVVLPLIKEEAEIYGFVATALHVLSSGIDMPPLGECKVFSNRVIFYLANELYRFPIFTSVHKASEERYGLQYLYVPRILNSPLGWNEKYYRDAMYKDVPDPRVSRVEDIQIENNVAYYYANKYDLFFESDSRFRAIGLGFVVITRRYSKLSGNIKYEIFDSHSVKIKRK